LLFACPPCKEVSEKSNLLKKLRKFLVEKTDKDTGEIKFPDIFNKFRAKNGAEPTIVSLQDFILKWASKPNTTTEVVYVERLPDPVVSEKIEKDFQIVQEERKDPQPTPTTASNELDTSEHPCESDEARSEDAVRQQEHDDSLAMELKCKYADQELS
jgi:hypothetical protein